LTVAAQRRREHVITLLREPVDHISKINAPRAEPAMNGDQRRAIFWAGIVVVQVRASGDVDKGHNSS